MVALPSPVLEYLSSTLLIPRSPAYLRVDKDGRLFDWGGSLKTYGLVDLQQGEPVEEQILFLSGFFPLENTPVYLPSMKTEAGYPVDIHLISGTGEDWVLLLDATQEEERQQLLQQKTNELALLRQQHAPRQSDIRLPPPTDDHRHAADRPKDHANETQHEPHESDDDLAALRQLLVGPEQNQLRVLQEQLDTPRIDAAAVSRILPEAISLRTRQNGQAGQNRQDLQLATALTPTIEASLQASVKKDPKPLIDAIFPVLGPAIRKAIAQALEGLLQSINTTLDHSFSLKGLRWRMEAVRTGRPFAEVVLSHTLLFRVEQVFLIHRDSGLPLLHVNAGRESAQSNQSENGEDSVDMVSGMLTAIQDFARDSFDVSADEGLESFRIGELAVWIEPGPHAIIAGVIRGNAPPELHAVFQDAIETIHLEQPDILASFNGETDPFEACRPQLEACLQLQHQETPRSQPSVFLWLLLGAALIGVGLWLFGVWQERSHWAAYVDRLHAEPGIVVTATERRDGQYIVAGLRDPLAADPDHLLRETTLEPERIISRWEPYQTLQPDFVHKRVTRILSPPATVRLTFDQGQLTAIGSAPHKWIVTAKMRAPVIAGVSHFQTDTLIDADLQAVRQNTAYIKQTRLQFAPNVVILSPDQEEVVALLTNRLQHLFLHAGHIGRQLQIVIVGSTDSTGDPAMNRQLSQSRADHIRSLLVAAGIPASSLQTHNQETHRVQTAKETKQETEQEKALNRSVSFRVRQVSMADIDDTSQAFEQVQDTLQP